VVTFNELQMPPCPCPPPHAARFDSHNKGHPLSQQQSRSQRMIPCNFAPKKDPSVHHSLQLLYLPIRSVWLVAVAVSHTYLSSAQPRKAGISKKGLMP
jgi:hypothetical protein